MEERLSVAFVVLKVLAVFTTLLNESVLVASQWIFTPSPAYTGFPHPAFTSTAYALLEPANCWLLARIGFPPWILMMLTPQHLWLCELSITYLGNLLKEKHLQASPRQAPGDTKMYVESERPGVTSLEPQPHANERRSDWGVYIATLLPVQSAAASNAALLLFSADLDASVESQQASSGTLLTMSCLGMLFYLSSRYADIRISRRVKKFSTQLSQRSTVAIQLSCLALVLSLRAFTRALLNLPPIYWPLTMGSTIPHHGDERGLGTWLHALVVRTPNWVPLLLAILSIPVSIYGAHRFRTGLEER